MVNILLLTLLFFDLTDEKDFFHRAGARDKADPIVAPSKLAKIQR